jgi:predicted DNA-binding transcriptional regulator AlpA
MDGDLIKSNVLAEEWDVSERTLANWRSARQGPPFVKIGGVVRYSRSAVTTWLAEQQRERVQIA